MANLVFSVVLIVVFATTVNSGYIPYHGPYLHDSGSANVDVVRSPGGFSYSKQEVHPGPVKVYAPVVPAVKVIPAPVYHYEPVVPVVPVAPNIPAHAGPYGYPSNGYYLH